MKFLKYIGAALAIVSLGACSLDEEYKTQLDQNAVYTTSSGYQGLINACYENLYYMYGKEDGIPMMEMGDLWQNGSQTSSNWKECVNNYEWNTECGYNKVIWNALYATVAYCNTAIHYQDKCTEIDSVAIKAKVAEAYFMRAFAYFHIVEQWGGVTLTTTSMAEDGARESATRNTEDEIYDQITADLDSAYKYLPESQGEERGRVNKWAACAMLAKVWAQRTRLERDNAANKEQKAWSSMITNKDNTGTVKYTAKQCAEKALDYAKMVIDKSPYKLYASTDTESGNSIEWSGDNNKNNSEFIMVEAIDHVGGYNPEAWNRGRTRQYYLMALGTQAQDFGVAADGLRYGRANTTRVHPTYYLLHDCFDPRPSRTDAQSIVYDGVSTSSKDLKRANDYTVDTRFNDAFYYKYFINGDSYTVPYDLEKRVGKDTLYFGDEKNGPTRRKITGNVLTGEQLKAQYPGANYYADATTSVSTQIFEMEDKPAAIGCYTPNFPVDSAWAAKKKYLVAGIPDANDNVVTNTGIFNYLKADGTTASNSYYRSLSPSLRKLSPLKYIYTNQQSMNDFPIIRLTDIYLLAAEMEVLIDDAQAGVGYLNAVRMHAALSLDANAISVKAIPEDAHAAEYGVDGKIAYLAKERARELCGENWRWYDLKRMGLLTAAYLNSTTEPKNPYGQPYQTKWYVRPIPQQFLDQVANPDEYGSNGY